MPHLSITACLALLAITAQSQDTPSERLTDWSPLFEDANRTARAEMKSYNVSEPFSNSPTSLSWEVRAQIRTNADSETVLQYTGGESTDESRTLHRINFRLPDELLDEEGESQADDSWGYCYVAHQFVGLNLTNGADVQSDCSGVFSDECLEWLNEFADAGSLCRRRTSPERYFPWEDSPCEDYGRRAFPSPADMTPFRYGNLSSVGRAGANVVLVTGPEDRWWEEALDSVWFLSVGYVPGPVGESDFGASSRDELPPSSMACIGYNMSSSTEGDSGDEPENGVEREGSEGDSEDDDDGSNEEEENGNGSSEDSGGNEGGDSDDGVGGMFGLIPSAATWIVAAGVLLLNAL
ncbi:hypothetical protein CC79DRAFT_1323022 [Sarocladium strictum]